MMRFLCRFLVRHRNPFEWIWAHYRITAIHLRVSNRAQLKQPE